MESKNELIIDYISGLKVKATPEEVDAVQVFSKILVEDYHYPKEYIQTRPQYRVKARPSDTKKEYPVDIAVFSDASKSEDALSIIVECKKKTRKDGRSQLEDYLRLSNATLGVWFNGNERSYIRKIESKGKVYFEEIPNIPQKGQRVEDIGKYKRKGLKPTHNLKTTFNAIRNYLVANATGTNRDEIIAQQLINIIFCKIYDEKFTEQEEIVGFRAGIDESSETIKERINGIFDKVKGKYNEVISISDSISLGAEEIKYIVGELQGFCLIESERDVIADAFETFIQDALKGGQGQFFTPRNVVKLLVELIAPKPNELLIDPACGTGGFLVESLRYLWHELERESTKYGWPKAALQEEKISAAIKCIKGIEKDDFLCKVAKAYMAILGDGKGGLFCEDSINTPESWNPITQQSIKLGNFDVLLTNPPFGKDIKVVGESKLKQYDLAHKWKKQGNRYEKTSKLKTEETIQILFIERSIKLLRDGGRMGIILPETFFHAPKMGYVLQYMAKGNNIKYLIDLPHNTFRPYNNAKCVALIMEKGRKQQDEITMIVAEEIGHDHNGKPMYRWDSKKRCITEEIWDDIPLIIDEIKNGKNKYVFDIDSDKVFKKQIMVPRYYWQDSIERIKAYANDNNINLVSINTLIEEGVITAFDGHGSPPAEYKGKGDIPYIRVKDIVNWEIYKDPTSKITEEIYNSFDIQKKEIKPYDIAYVRRGSYRIGSVAMVSPYDTKALYTREILFFRVCKESNKYNLTPHYLLYLLSHNLVAAQSKNKILIETTLPNIADRWKELLLPFSKDVSKIETITNMVKSAIDSKWKAISNINTLRRELGDLTT